MSELRKGDYVEVKQLRLTGAIIREEWALAQVIETDDYRIGVRFKKDPTKLLMLERRESPPRFRELEEHAR